jgi:hypothetical protein
LPVRLRLGGRLARQIYPGDADRVACVCPNVFCCFGSLGTF